MLPCVLFNKNKIKQKKKNIEYKKTFDQQSKNQHLALSSVKPFHFHLYSLKFFNNFCRHIISYVVANSIWSNRKRRSAISQLYHKIAEYFICGVKKRQEEMRELQAIYMGRFSLFLKFSIFFHSCDAFGFIWSVFKSKSNMRRDSCSQSYSWWTNKKRVRSFDLPWRASCDGSTSWSWLWIAYHSADIGEASHQSVCADVCSTSLMCWILCHKLNKHGVFRLIKWKKEKSRAY